MTFQLVVEHERKKYRVTVEQVLLTKELEQYRITTRSKSVVMQSNRPLLRNKGLKHKKPVWKSIEGIVNNTYVIGKIIEELMKVIDK